MMVDKALEGLDLSPAARAFFSKDGYNPPNVADAQALVKEIRAMQLPRSLIWRTRKGSETAPA